MSQEELAAGRLARSRQAAVERLTACIPKGLGATVRIENRGGSERLKVFGVELAKKVEART
jgi:hypothetical protein